MNDATIESIRKVALDPGDILVCNFRQRLTDEQCARVKQLLLAAFGDENKILVLTEDAQFSVIRRHRPSIMQRARTLRRIAA